MVSVITGDNTSDFDGLGESQSQITQGSFVLNHDFSEQWHYKFQHDFGYLVQGFNQKAAAWYGIEQDLFYDLTPTLSAGVRGEWFRDEDGLKNYGRWRIRHLLYIYRRSVLETSEMVNHQA